MLGTNSPFAGKATPDGVKALGLQLDPDDDEAEQAPLNAVADNAAAKLTGVLRTQLNALASQPPAVAVGAMQNFDHGVEMQQLLFTVLVDGADAGAGVAQDTLARIGATFDFDLVHEHAQRWARQYSYDLVKGITATTRQGLQTAVGDWIGQGQPLSTLISQVQPLFGANRAKAIAFTETTRAFAEGSITSFEASGVVQGFEWMTARDERVCPVCGGYYTKQFPLRGPVRPPAHVGCRCWPIPTILEERAKPKPAKPEPKPAPTAPVIAQSALDDPTATLIWAKDAAYEGEMLNGVALKPAKAGYWTKIKDKVLVDEPALPTGQRVATGLVIVEPDGRVWIVEPKGHYGGYQHTFPKGGLEKDLTAQQNALKEAFEESGLKAKITGYVGDFQGTTGVTRYYLAKRTGGAPWTSDDETATVKLTPISGAGDLLNVERDRKVLAAVQDKLAQPKQKQPKGDGAFPTDPDGLDVVKRLGGSTGAELVRDPLTQQLYVRKRGADPGHLREEVYADGAYQALGVKVPEFKLYETGTGPVKLARYIEGKTLGNLRTADPAAYQAAIKALQQDFAVDALLGNWDVVGMSYDNVLVDAKGTVWRIDNGGSLRRRAQGALKRPADFNEHVGEFWSLRDDGVNQQTAAAFGDMSYSDVLDSMAGVAKKEKALLKALPTELQETVKARMATVKDLLDTGRTLQADQWTDNYNDDFARHIIGIRKAGIKELFPQRLENEGVDIVDETGKPFDNLRGAGSTMYRVADYIKQQGGDYRILSEWMEAQAFSSWSEDSQAFKYFFAQQRGGTKDYFWLENKFVKGSNGARQLYEQKMQQQGDAYKETLTAWHAFNYEFVRSVPFANNNLKKGVIKLMRTESDDVINKYLRLGETGQMLRGPAESTSIFEPVTVAGNELTIQQVPHHRILGNYFFERLPGRSISPFLGDDENEFIALLAGLDVTYKESY